MISDKNNFAFALLAAAFAVPALSLSVSTFRNNMPASGIEIASRYQLRNRTPSFFERSKTGPRHYGKVSRSMRA